MKLSIALAGRQVTEVRERVPAGRAADGYRLEPMKDVAQRLITFLEERFEVDAVWLFGSQARGDALPVSDIDLAVLFRRAPEAIALLDAKAHASLLADRPVDLVDVERASPILAMQVLRHGRLLVDNDPSRRLRFSAAVPGRREDLLLIRRPIERRLLERVTHGRA